MVKTLHQCPPKLIQCIKLSFSLTAGARFRWINNKSVPHSSSVFACRRGKNTCAPSIVYRLLIGWNCHTTWSQGNLHYMRLHFLKLDREFFCLQPSLARLYSAAASTCEHLRSNGSLAIMHTLKTGLIADKFASFWMFPKGLYHSLFCFINDLYILYNYWLNTWKT